MEAKTKTRMRRGNSADEPWLFELFKATMRDHIDAVWGWEELLQKEGFNTSLPAKNFLILELESNPVACLHISDKSDHLLLDMILVEPNWQQQGLGSQLIFIAQESARQKEKPIRLSVLKTNPALAFHQKNGFKVIEDDEHSYKMQWSAD